MDNNISKKEKREIDLLDFTYELLRRRKFLVTFVVSVNVLALIILLLIPRYYEGRATVMPSQQKNQMNASSLLKGVLPLGGLGFAKASEELLVYMTILNSRNCYESMVSRYNLIDRYHCNNLEDALKELKGNIDVATNSDETALEIKVYDRDSSTAKDMAGFLIDLLNKIYVDMNIRDAKNNREFIGQRYDKILTDLAVAEDSLRAFQERYGVYTPTDQVKAAITAAAQIQSNIAMREVELGVIQKTLQKESPEAERLQLEIHELQRQLNEMDIGNTGGSSPNVFIPFAKVPARGLQYLRFFREVEIQTKLQETVLPLLEQASIEEHRDTPTVVVLDYPNVSYRPVRPKRLVVFVFIFLGSVFAGVSIVSLQNFYERMKSTTSSGSDQKLQYVIEALKPRKFFKFDRR
jgi:capsule polysaccharide export protein KpsE/RkpR